MLYLCPHNTDYSISVASTETGAVLWHHRFGHMSEKGMQIIHSRKLLPDLKQVSLEFYENCVYGKQKRVRFLRVGKQKKSENLELVHTDVWGPAQVQSLSGSCYYVTLLMMQLEKLGFIAFDKNLMCLILLRSGNLWLRMRQEKGLNVSDLIMEVNNTGRSLTVTIHTNSQKEDNPWNTTRKWRVRKDEQNDHGACKVCEIACRVSLTFLG